MMLVCCQHQMNLPSPSRPKPPQRVSLVDLTAQTLRDLTGILKYDRLQEVFGAPRLQDGVFNVTRHDVLRQRTGPAYLIGDRWLDGGSALIAFVALLPIWPIWGTRWWLDIFITLASIYQVAGWVAIMQMMKRR
mgnify:CR=1 FL=1